MRRSSARKTSGIDGLLRIDLVLVTSTHRVLFAEKYNIITHNVQNVLHVFNMILNACTILNPGSIV